LWTKASLGKNSRPYLAKKEKKKKERKRKKELKAKGLEA
jgi:hypothetical protein